VGIAAAGRERYESARKKLFPRGDYWDEQFADPESDVSLFVKAKAGELINFRGRMSALQDESRIETTSGLIADWERVLLGEVTYGKTPEERRLLLKSKKDTRLNRTELQKTANMYGLSTAGVSFPYRPAFFGHACFNTSFLGGPVAFSVLLITAGWDRRKFHTLFSEQQFIMRFGLDRLAWSPFVPHVEKAFIKFIVRKKQLFKDFEQAIQDNLLASQIPFFNYEGV
jgi:hypothetical protein